MANFITIVNTEGVRHALNKDHILSVEVNTKGYLMITMGFKTDEPYIRYYTLDEDFDSFMNRLRDNSH